MDDNSIHALIRLVEDPDEQVFEQVRMEICALGTPIIPLLEQSWEEDFSNELHQHRIEKLIHDIQFQEVYNQLRKWKFSDDKDLLEGALLIAQSQYPDLDKKKVLSNLYQIRDAVWLEISAYNTSYEKVKILNRILFDQYQFSVNKINYFSPLNSYLNTVLDLRLGNAMSLAIVYSLVANLLDIPLYGIVLPNYFILAYMDELHVNHELGRDDASGVLFYVDPFHRGRILRREDILYFFEKFKLEYNRSYFEPSSNSLILRRMLANLIYAYQRMENQEKAEELKKLENLLK